MLTKKINVGISDDHPLFRRMLRHTLSQQESLHVALQASDIFDLMTKLKSFYVNIIVVNASMLRSDGIDDFRTIRSEYPDIRIIVLTMSTNIFLVKDLLDIGIFACISEEDEPENLLEAIVAASENRIYRNKMFTEALYIHKETDLGKSGSRQDIQFDERDKRIIQLLWEEKTNKEIANEIFLSVRSVEKIRQDMKEKLGVRSTIGLLKYALSQKIIQSKTIAGLNLSQAPFSGKVF